MAVKSNNTIYFNKSQGVPDRPSYGPPNHSMMLMAIILEIMKYVCKVIRIQKLSGKETFVGHDDYQKQQHSSMQVTKCF